MQHQLEQVVTRLREARQVAAFTHLRPDPDALGSQAALALLLRRAGASRVVAVNFDAPPRQYAFLQDGIETANWTPDFGRSASFDTILVADTCTYQQLEPAADFLRQNRDKVVAIDHHLSRDDLGPVILDDSSAAACVELIVDVAHGLGVVIDEPIATRLMCGLVADTGWFRFDSVTPRTMRVAAELIAAGAQPAELYERLQQNETKPKLALMQHALDNLHWAASDRLALMSLSLRDFSEAGATPSQTEELVNFPLMVGTVEVVGLLTEMPDGRVRASLRSKHHVDVNAICRQFGGGGHAKAAGCRLDGSLESARARLIAAVEAALK